VREREGEGGGWGVTVKASLGQADTRLVKIDREVEKMGEDNPSQTVSKKTGEKGKNKITFHYRHVNRELSGETRKQKILSRCANRIARKGGKRKEGRGGRTS